MLVPVFTAKSRPRCIFLFLVTGCTRLPNPDDLRALPTGDPLGICVSIVVRTLEWIAAISSLESKSSPVPNSATPSTFSRSPNRSETIVMRSSRSDRSCSRLCFRSRKLANSSTNVFDSVANSACFTFSWSTC